MSGFNDSTPPLSEFGSGGGVFDAGNLSHALFVRSVCWRSVCDSRNFIIFVAKIRIMKFSQYLLLTLKGCAMGMADVVPGVSGGTIAFISGIYEELIESIKSVDATALRLLGTLRLKEFWRHINGRFLLPVLLGIAVAIFSLARLMTYLLTHHPIAIWSFFFGLIVASALLVARDVTRWNAASVVSLLCGIAVAWWITVASPSQTPETWWFILLSGAIAICAMILPGISGAFILLLMGKYQFILNAVSSFDIGILALFATGAVAGLSLIHI